MKPETQEELATMIFEVQNWSDATLVAVQLWPHLNGPAQPTLEPGAMTFGASVENIAASDRNPIKRGIFIRKISRTMAEYATKEGVHSTPLDNLRALAAQPPAAPVEVHPAEIEALERTVEEAAKTCNSYLQRAIDAEADALRLHNEKMAMYERAIEAEAKLAAHNSSSAGNVDAGAKRLAAWISYVWDGIKDGRISDRGDYPQWSYNGIGALQYQGGKDDLRDLAREIAHLVTEPQGAPQRDPMIAAVASLAAAISLLERTPKAKKAAPSDKMFDQMLDDYRKALANARDALALSRPHRGSGE